MNRFFAAAVLLLCGGMLSAQDDYASLIRIEQFTF